MTHGTATIEHVEPGTNTAAEHTRKFTSPPTRLMHWKLSRNRTRCTLHIQQKYRILRDTSAIAPIVRNDRNNYTSFYETRTSVIHIIPFHNNTMMNCWHEIHRWVTSTGLHLLRGMFWLFRNQGSPHRVTGNLTGIQTGARMKQVLHQVNHLLFIIISLQASTNNIIFTRNVCRCQFMMDDVEWITIRMVKTVVLADSC